MGDNWRTKLGPGVVSFEYHLTSKRVVLTYPHPRPCTVVHLVEKNGNSKHETCSHRYHGPIPLNSSPVQKVHMDTDHSENRF